MPKTKNPQQILIESEVRRAHDKEPNDFYEAADNLSNIPYIEWGFNESGDGSLVSRGIEMGRIAERNGWDIYSVNTKDSGIWFTGDPTNILTRMGKY